MMDHLFGSARSAGHAARCAARVRLTMRCQPALSICSGLHTSRRRFSCWTRRPHG